MIDHVVKKGLCTGCGTCYSICPSSAIDLIKDDTKGIYQPHTIQIKCKNCKICTEICPGHSVDFDHLNLEIFGKNPNNIYIGNYENCRMGYSTDQKIRYNSASGGLITQTLLFALENGIINGALVTRMKRNNPLDPEPFIARTKKEIVEAAKSKYCPVPANIALKEILNSDDGEKFAIVGLPCHIHGVRKAELRNNKLKNKIAIHIGIFCAKTISFSGTKILLENLGIKETDVEKLDYRGDGWPGKMTITLKSGKRKYLDISEYYSNRFDLSVPWRCLLCSDFSNELADLSFGDAWLPEIMARDKVGTSIVISRNAAVENLITNMEKAKLITICKIDFESVKRSQENFAWKKKDLQARLHISRLMNKPTPDYRGMSLLQPTVINYLASNLFFLKRFVASRRKLHKILDVYTSIKRS